jgi:hypothetical protein
LYKEKREKGYERLARESTSPCAPREERTACNLKMEIANFEGRVPLWGASQFHPCRQQMLRLKVILIEGYFSSVSGAAPVF